jgi:DNA-binding MarR family transcriptional regulator
MNKLPKEKYGLWITELILYADLSPIEKLILADIVTICSNDSSYFKLNQNLADMLRVSVKTITRVIKSLELKKLIIIKFSRPYDNVKTKRTIYPYYINIKKLKVNNNSKINK